MGFLKLGVPLLGVPKIFFVGPQNIFCGSPKYLFVGPHKKDYKIFGGLYWVPLI